MYLKPKGQSSEALKKIWLFVIAITIHNIPEGLAVALALQGEGYSKRYAFAIACRADGPRGAGGGCDQGRGGRYFGICFLPWGLVFAAGTMIYVISHEIIPEMHRRGHQDAATIGLMIGLVLMLFLDVSLG